MDHLLGDGRAGVIEKRVGFGAKECLEVDHDEPLENVDSDVEQAGDLIAARRRAVVSVQM